VSGYTGGGKAMIAEFEDEAAGQLHQGPVPDLRPGPVAQACPEIQKHGGLLTRPIFTPAVGRYAQGMLVELPLHMAC
jgi:N-acetyl-gamma-glutamyl-phosphate reductase